MTWLNRNYGLAVWLIAFYITIGIIQDNWPHWVSAWRGVFG